MPPAPLDPVGLDGSPAQAFASHHARASGIARHFALTRTLDKVRGQADENNTVALIAHLHTVAGDPDFAAPGQEASRTAIPAALRRLNRGDDGGQVGTFGKYDFALKGLMTIAYRYRHLLSVEDFNFILDALIPAEISGDHPPEIEILEVSFLQIDIPETENHLLMTEGSRYLINQLFRERAPGDPRFDNVGLGRWLLGYMQRIAKHDFLEFNARPYARLSLHALYNLHEFAQDAAIRDAAQILLDYTMVKFALSSSRGRRISPFRRLQPRIAHQGNRHDELLAMAGDQVAGCFLSYTGAIDGNGNPAPFPASLDYPGLIAATAAYRPPPAAYILALLRNNTASLHRFHHGARPEVPASGDIADAGIEIYYHSPSFLLSAGGMFLNSGYGRDEVGMPIKPAWRDTARAQATTLIPTRADVAFHDLLRFEAYPDSPVDPYGRVPDHDDDEAELWHAASVNIGVHRRLMAGANMRPAEKKTIFENATTESPALAFHDGGLFVAWKGSGNDNLSLARVQMTTLFGIDGVEGIEQKVVLAETSGGAPALASLDSRLFLAWRGSGNDNLNLMFTKDGGKTWRGKVTLAETSKHAPALVAHRGILLIAWTGRGDGNLNIAKLAFTPEGNAVLVDKVVLGDTSDQPPALASHLDRLFLAWKGAGNDAVNLMFSEDDGATFRGKATFAETSSHAPSLAGQPGALYMAWKGSGNENLNVARVTLVGNTAGAFGIEGLGAKVVLGEISTQPPTLGIWNDRLMLGWKGEGDDFLNLRCSRDGSFRAPGPWLCRDLRDLGFYIAAYRTAPSRTDDLDPPPENLGFVYVVEKADMDAQGLDFNAFEATTKALNAHLPATLDYGSTVEFHAPDGGNFAIWFQLTGDKYLARITDLADPVRDLATLPLVSGQFLSSPGGHDGRILVSYPGTEKAPLVLNYSVAERPTRSAMLSPALPWNERVKALFALAPRLAESGLRPAMHAALSDAAFLYDAMLRQNSEANGPLLAPDVIAGLATMGVDFSVAESELREWLANPEFTPYPAIAQSLLQWKRQLKAPVFIDVIGFNYEQRAPSPRTVADVRPDVLHSAILEGWNVRYGQQVEDIEQILVT